MLKGTPTFHGKLFLNGGVGGEGDELHPVAQFQGWSWEKQNLISMIYWDIVTCV